MNLIDLSQQEWDDLYGQLLAFADFTLQHKRWFRKTKDSSFLKGKMAHDYVVEAVTRHLEHPEKYDPTKRTLLRYLQKHILKTLIYDDAVSKENKGSIDAVGARLDCGGEYIVNIEDMLPAADALFDDELDYNQIIGEIKEGITQDQPALVIFDAICQGTPRKDVIEEQGWTKNIYDNGMKRLDRVRLRVAEKYHITQ